ncbi:MAG TPA: NAD(P)/FAD-dependent oxidoreductase [Burkholderiaceae bacterium]|nr:NAD(P)/FAD-dependent oxidoreductase [Burkholderiaceae bacterium]
MSESNAISCDVAIVGGGPAGSTTAALLAAKGYRVELFEKDHHPRFHIGESLLPQNLYLFEQLGVAKKIAAIGMVKHAAEFYSTEHAHMQAFSFAEAFDARFPYAYQVRRSEFDQILFENARAKGAVLHEGWKVLSVDFNPGPVTLTVAAPGGVNHTVQARYLVDATGRDTFLAGKFGIKRKNPKHTSAAIYGHFRNARRNEGAAEGNIGIYWFPHGWCWFIPLADGVTSVGAVCWPYWLKTRRTDSTTFLLETLKLAPKLWERVKDAALTAPATATGNYSYTAGRLCGDRYIMVGDAFAFVDPVFSSGVYLGMKSATLAADVVDGALCDPAAAARLNRAYERLVKRGLRRFQWLIYRMTQPMMRDLIMGPRDTLGIKRAVVSLLAGDVYRFGPVWWRLMAFRGIYYVNCALRARQAWRAWRERRQAIVPQVIHATDGSG